MKKCLIILIKLKKRVYSFIKKILWKIIYTRYFKCGKGTVFYPKTHIVIDKQGQIKIGNNCFFNCNCSINSMNSIIIGNDCIFGENICIYDHNHQYKVKDVLIRKQGFQGEKVVVGNNCWIGSNVVILSGVTIGDNVVIGAGVVITKSIPDNSVVVSTNKIRYITQNDK